MMKNVQPIAAAALLVVLALVVGCDRPQESEEPHDTGRFGSPYQIITNESPAEPDEPPAILADSLSVLLTYPGGCEDHRFELASRIEGDRAEVWLRHDNRGDRCEAQISERLVFELPEPVLEARSIHLLNPEADVPFVLRWDVQPATGVDPDDTTRTDTLN